MSGIFSRKANLGDMVKKNDLIGILRDPLGDDCEDIRAPFSSVVIGQLNLPLAHEGDALIHLAKITAPGEAEETLNDYATFLTDEDFALER